MVYTRFSILLVAALFLCTSLFAQYDTTGKAPGFYDSVLEHYRAELSVFEKEHGHFIQTPNVKMHYLTWGRPTGKTIIWSHGTFGNAYEMFGFADSFVKRGYHVVAIDYYGHGLTPIPAHEVSLYHVADDIKCIMDQLHIKKAVIGGFSRGGSVSTAFYDAYPQRTAALILEDGGSVAWPTNVYKEPIDSIIAQTERSYMQRRMPAPYDKLSDMMRNIYRRVGDGPTFRYIAFLGLNVRKQDSNGKWIFNPGVEELVCERTAKQLIWAMYHPMAADHLFGASSQLLYPRIIYRNLDVPMLILDPVSDDDSFDFEKDNNELQQSHPLLITHKVYQKTGHAVKSEHPAEFVQDVSAFLNAVSFR